MKSRKEVIERALKILGVLAYDEALTADQEAEGGAVLDSIFSKLNGQVPPATFELDSIPEEAFMPLANLLAAYVAPDYGQQATMGIGRAWLHLRSVYVPAYASECQPPETGYC